MKYLAVSQIPLVGKSLHYGVAIYLKYHTYHFGLRKRLGLPPFDFFSHGLPKIWKLFNR